MKQIGHRYVTQYIHLKGPSPTNIKIVLNSTLGGGRGGVHCTYKCTLAHFHARRSDEIRQGVQVRPDWQTASIFERAADGERVLVGGKTLSPELS